MILQKIKEKIFALYWDQNINTSINGTPISSRWMLKLENEELDACIMVKPLSQISDEDAIEVAKIIFKNKFFHTSDRGKRYIKWMIEADQHYYGSYFSYKQVCNTVDYLRSKGYALPYLNYSVDDLVKEGVFIILNQ